MSQKLKQNLIKSSFVSIFISEKMENEKELLESNIIAGRTVRLLSILVFKRKEIFV